MTKQEETGRPSRDKVTIKGKDGEAEVLRTAYDKVWKDRGYSEVKTSEKTTKTAADAKKES